LCLCGKNLLATLAAADPSLKVQRFQPSHPPNDAQFDEIAANFAKCPCDIDDYDDISDTKYTVKLKNLKNFANLLSQIGFKNRPDKCIL